MNNNLENTEIRYLKSQITALEQLLEAYEKTALEQTEKLDRDISERKKAEEAIKDNEQFLQILIDSIPVPVFYKDRDGKYIGCNEAFEDFLGMRKREIIGKTVYDVAPKELADSYYEADTALFRSMGNQVYESRVKHSNGSVRDVIFHKAVFFDRKGELAGLIGVILDITDRKRMEDSLKSSEASLAHAQRIAHLGSWERDIVTDRLYWSDETYRILGLTPQSIGLTYEAYLNFVHPDNREFVKKSVLDALSRKKPYSIDYRIILRDGLERIVHSEAEIVFDHAGNPIKMRGTIQDITDRKQIEEILRYRTDFEKTVAAISKRFITLSDFDTAVSTSLADAGRLCKAGRVCLFQFRNNGTIMDNTYEWCDTGVTAEIQRLQNIPSTAFPWVMTNLKTRDIIHIDDVSQMPPEASAEKAEFERKSVKSILIIPLLIKKILIGFIGFGNIKTTSQWSGEDIAMLYVVAEIIGNAIERKQSEELIKNMAYHDSLTQLPNRNLFQDHLQVAMSHARRNKTLVAVIILDLDDFKTINDSLGHHMGDSLLKVVANRLMKCMREGDTVARTGGDEFMVILPGLVQPQSAVVVTQKILGTLDQPFLIDGLELHTTASVGISLFPDNANDAESLMKQADIAMYLAKKNGKNTYYFYKPGIIVHA
ncbi:MAG: diguanylate cyclase [Candidatus Brocadiales bacterium]|nr:diguanylate cyclase [Candidatus Brocadiales bacterium]